MKASFTLIALLVVGSASAQDVSSLGVGLYDPDEKALLGPAFINAVNRWLGRYEPRLVERIADSVKMQAKYDYLYDIHLVVNAEDYEVRVTLAESVKNPSKAQNNAAHLSSGVLKTMENLLVRGTRVRDRTGSEGVR
jgi:hypothetical protein